MGTPIASKKKSLFFFFGNRKISMWKRWPIYKIGEAVLKLFNQTAPEFVCGILGSIITVVSVILSPFLIGLIIKIIKVPFKIFKTILGG